MKKFFTTFCIVVFSCRLVFAQSYTSPNYSLFFPRIVVSSGQANSPAYSLNNVRIGNFLTGNAASPNYSLSFDEKNVSTITIPVNPPTVTPVVTPTNIAYQILSGTKDSSTAIYRDGYLVVALDSATTWSYEQSLNEGDNYFIITARDISGEESTSVSVNIFTDTTPSSLPVVLDDGIYTTEPTLLHATWTADDLQTGIQEYLYAIGTSSGATDIVPWTSAGVETEITYTGLSLVQGQTYYISVKAKNGVDSWSNVGVSDGIKMNQNLPVITNVILPMGNTGYPGNDFSSSVNAGDLDGDTLSYQFSIDETIVQSWQLSSSFIWTTTKVAPGVHTLKTEVRDGNGGQAVRTEGICLFRKPPDAPQL